jgi:hypothetical protein
MSLKVWIDFAIFVNSHGKHRHLMIILTSILFMLKIGTGAENHLK